ncbi:MAG TPA: hypothetical protein VD866_04025 [Urbifossiella sp.]|nr:hypothetical protein [Urbifossiella sp.]
MSDDDTDPLLDRRRRLKRAAEHRRRLLTVVALFLVAVGAVVGVFAWGWNRTAVVEPGKGAGDRVPERVTGEPPADWTHAELAAYLKKRGVGAELEGGLMISGVTYSTFTDPITKQKASVELAPDAKTAREMAAADNKTFAWGRFVIRRSLTDDEPYAARIRAALK